VRWVAAAILLVLAGCGGGDDQIVVSAASSLTKPLTACSGDDVKLAFGGSDELAAQIRQGVKPDVYAAANTKLPAALAHEKLIEPPSVFASNELVLAVPKDDDGVQDIDDLARPGVTLAIGSASVPVGGYTREVLRRLGAKESRAILANVRSNEPDVKGVVGKLVQKAADAGFVYRSDVEATKGELEAIDLPDELEPTVAYAAGVVKGTKQPAAAQAFVDDLREGNCHDALLTAGFGEPPP
jgi:molybdate transport system substrate-binding protein